MDAESWVAADKYEKNLQKKVVEWLKEFPPAELDREYARAVRNWLLYMLSKQPTIIEAEGSVNEQN